MAERDELGPLVEALVQELLLVCLPGDFPSKTPNVDLTFARDHSTVAKTARDRLQLHVQKVCGVLVSFLTGG